MAEEFPSPHSGILFLFYPGKLLLDRMKSTVSVPSFGDSFFISNHQLYTGERYQKGFRPLIRGFFFYTLRNKDYPFMIANVFPSPHSGILFLSKMYELNIQADNEFPSPHSGILFLLSIRYQYII